VVVTVPIDLTLNVALGASVAVASRAVIAQYPLLRSPALWALIVLEAMVFVPIGMYLLLRFPAWSLMYLWEPGQLPIPDPALALLYPVAGVASFVATRRFLIGDKLLPAISILAGGGLLALIIAYAGRRNLMLVGTVAAFRESPDGMLSVFDSALFYLVGVSGLALTAGWVATLWRLSMLSQSRSGGVEAEAVREARSTTRKSQTRKKTS